MLRIALSLAGLLFASSALPQADPLAPAREEFVNALAAVPRDAGIANDSSRLRSYPLYSYLEAERLQWRLARVEPKPDTEIAALLGRDGDAPWTRGLRNAWLKTLADEGRWPEFLAYYVDARADTALRCHQLNAQIVTGSSAALVGPALAIWNTGSELPQACTPVIDWLKAEGALGLPP
jgi:soluble lytic murein transglycosylase